MAKVAFERNVTIFEGNVSLLLKKRLVKYLVCSVLLYGSEIWSMRKAEQKKLKAFEMWVRRKVEG